MSYEKVENWLAATFDEEDRFWFFMWVVNQGERFGPNLALTGDQGVGKSRLAHELSKWLSKRLNLVYREVQDESDLEENPSPFNRIYTSAVQDKEGVVPVYDVYMNRTNLTVPTATEFKEWFETH